MSDIATPSPAVQPPGDALVPTAEAAGATTLKRNTLSMPEVLAQSVANMAPTAAMALLPLLVFTNAGNGTWVSFVIAVVLMTFVGYCASQFARRMNSAGGFYVWVTRGLGPVAGHSAGWGLQLGYITTGMATIFGFAIFGSDFLTRIGLPGDSRVVLAVLMLIDFALPTYVALRDMQLSARTSLTLESISITIILILCVAIWIHHGTVFDTSQISLEGVGTGGVVVGVVLAIFAFVGFESAGQLGMEARNPQRAIGRSILYSALIVGIFYVVVSYSQVFGFKGTEPGFAKSAAPLPDLAGIVGLGWVAPVIDLGIVAGMFACTLACINAAARLGFTMAHDGMGHAAMARTHHEHRTPHIAIWIFAVPMVIVPVLVVVLGQDVIAATGWVGTLATFGFMLAYALVSVAAPVFLWRIGQAALLVTILGAIGTIAMLIVFWASWLPQTIPGGIFPELSGVYAWLPYIFLAWTAIGLIWYFVARSRDPELSGRVGSRFERAG